MTREARGRVLPSSATQHFTRCLHDLTLDLFTHSGPFWTAVDEFRRHWGIDPVTQLPTESDWATFPPFGPKASYFPFVSDGSKRHKPSDPLKSWQEDLTSLLSHLLANGFIPPPCVIPGPFERSLRHWMPFLAACVQFDPPAMELLAFADQFLPLPETLEEAAFLSTAMDTSGVGSSPSMV